jgi:Uma2 family endonuclease
MSVGTLIPVEEYQRTSFHPDRDFVEGEVVERNVGKRKQAWTQARIAAWFIHRQQLLRLDALTELRVQVKPNRVRIPDVVICEMPIPEEEVFTAPPYLCIEVMSPDDTIAAMQDRLDDYLQFGVPNVWVIDPWNHRGWRISTAGWATAMDATMRTADGRISLPLADVLLPA